MTKTMMAAKVSPENLRRAQRDLVDFRARATSQSNVHEVQIVNVSPLGLMGRIQTSVVAGEQLLFELPRVGHVVGSVRWVEDGRIGVEFTAAIKADRYRTMLALMPQRQKSW